MSRDEIIGIAEAYLNGLAKKDLSSVPFVMDITFEGPRMPKLEALVVTKRRAQHRLSQYENCYGALKTHKATSLPNPPSAL